MMRLENLIDRRGLVHKILGYWNYDEDRKEVLDKFRLSSNGVYPFMTDGHVNFLRYSPESEKDENLLRAELNYIRYLDQEGYGLAKVIPSKGGNDYEEIVVGSGKYYAVAFQKVVGKRMDHIKIDRKLLKRIGMELGQLHNLSHRYKPQTIRRKNHHEMFDWMLQIIMGHKGDSRVSKELIDLRNVFDGFPMDIEDYGLIHFDFELDNLFYEEEVFSMKTIDFDDSHYNWYVMDIVVTALNIAEECEAYTYKDALHLLLEGYESVFRINPTLLLQEGAFIRFMNLYTYCSLLWSLDCEVDKVPDWMKDLRKRFENNNKLYVESLGSIDSVN